MALQRFLHILLALAVTGAESYSVHRYGHHNTGLVTKIAALNRGNNVTINSVAREELRELLHTLDSHDEPLNEFMPRCLAHVKALVKDIDQSYSDNELERALYKECELSQAYPSTHQSGFKNNEACEDFARKLSAARRKELQTGDTSGYVEFCEEYHAHVEPTTRPPPAADGSVAPMDASDPTAQKPGAQPGAAPVPGEPGRGPAGSAGSSSGAGAGTPTRSSGGVPTSSSGGYSGGAEPASQPGSAAKGQPCPEERKTWTAYSIALRLAPTTASIPILCSVAWLLAGI